MRRCVVYSGGYVWRHMFDQWCFARFSLWVVVCLTVGVRCLLFDAPGRHAFQWGVLQLGDRVPGGVPLQGTQGAHMNDCAVFPYRFHLGIQPTFPSKFKLSAICQATGVIRYIHTTLQVFLHLSSFSQTVLTVLALLRVSWLVVFSFVRTYSQVGACDILVLHLVLVDQRIRRFGVTKGRRKVMGCGQSENLRRDVLCSSCVVQPL